MLAEGQRVRFKGTYMNFPNDNIKAGALGTLVRVVMDQNPCRLEIKLDDHYPDLDDWDNIVWISWFPDFDQTYLHAEQYLEAV